MYAGRFGVNLCGVDARLLVRSFIERELVPSPRESTRPWRLAEPVNALLSIKSPEYEGYRTCME